MELFKLAVRSVMEIEVVPCLTHSERFTYRSSLSLLNSSFGIQAKGSEFRVLSVCYTDLPASFL